MILPSSPSFSPLSPIRISFGFRLSAFRLDRPVPLSSFPSLPSLRPLRPHWPFLARNAPIWSLVVEASLEFGVWDLEFSATFPPPSAVSISCHPSSGPTPASPSPIGSAGPRAVPPPSLAPNIRLPSPPPAAVRLRSRPILPPASSRFPQPVETLHQLAPLRHLPKRQTLQPLQVLSQGVFHPAI